MRLLLIGFGPFPGAPYNPSAALAKALSRRRRPAFAGIERTLHIFSTVYSAVDRDLPRLFENKPDVVLIFGLAARRRHVCIETRARNAISVLFPDASGHRPQHPVIAADAPTAMQTRAPAARLLHTVSTAKVPARLSRDAGRYLCNYAYWHALRLASASSTLVQFVHIPQIVSAAAPRRRQRRPAPGMSKLVAATERLVVALLAASRH